MKPCLQVVIFWRWPQNLRQDRPFKPCLLQTRSASHIIATINLPALHAVFLRFCSRRADVKDHKASLVCYILCRQVKSSKIAIGSSYIALDDILSGLAMLPKASLWAARATLIQLRDLTSYRADHSKYRLKSSQQKTVLGRPLNSLLQVAVSLPTPLTPVRPGKSGLDLQSK